ncbi:Hypothetical predicted protein [Olea europaea subsp. europaea]|uniref:Uncharacterized protein n=1 Tax=Olea europaea subsp. europaea TaxID=158383 RepID=A0A8S0RD40_OLEEU|nr:Hypothetical predicted protein [Olea europaea subsp. europaea]
MANIEEQLAVVYFDDDADLNDSDFNDSNNDVYDDDDILFDHNVTKGIELDMPLTIEDGQASESDSSSHASSEELNIRSDSESDENSGRQKFPEYYAENENGKKKNPHLEVGLLFSSFEELKSILKDYAVFNGVEPILKRNDKDRVHCWIALTNRHLLVKLRGLPTERDRTAAELGGYGLGKATFVDSHRLSFSAGDGEEGSSLGGVEFDKFGVLKG